MLWSDELPEPLRSVADICARAARRGFGVREVAVLARKGTPLTRVLGTPRYADAEWFVFAVDCR